MQNLIYIIYILLYYTYCFWCFVRRSSPRQKLFYSGQICWRMHRRIVICISCTSEMWYIFNKPESFVLFWLLWFYWLFFLCILGHSKSSANFMVGCSSTLIYCTHSPGITPPCTQCKHMPVFTLSCYLSSHPFIWSMPCPVSTFLHWIKRHATTGT